MVIAQTIGVLKSCGRNERCTCSQSVCGDIDAKDSFDLRLQRTRNRDVGSKQSKKVLARQRDSMVCNMN